MSQTGLVVMTCPLMSVMTLMTALVSVMTLITNKTPLLTGLTALALATSKASELS